MSSNKTINDHISKKALQERKENGIIVEVHNPGLVSFEALIKFCTLQPVEKFRDPKTGEAVVYKDYDDQLYSKYTLNNKNKDPDGRVIKTLEDAKEAGFLMADEVERELQAFSPYGELAAFKSESTSTFLVAKQIQRLANESKVKNHEGKTVDLYDGKVSLKDLVEGRGSTSSGLYRVFDHLTDEIVLRDVLGKHSTNINFDAVKNDPAFAALAKKYDTSKNGQALEDIKFDVNNEAQLSAITNLVLKTIHKDYMARPFSQDVTLGNERPEFKTPIDFTATEIDKFKANYRDAIDDKIRDHSLLTNLGFKLPGNVATLDKTGTNTLDKNFHFANKVYTDTLLSDAASLSGIVANMDPTIITAILGVGTEEAKHIKENFEKFTTPQEKFGSLCTPLQNPEKADFQDYWTAEKTEHIREFRELVKDTNVAALMDGALYHIENAQGYNSQNVQNHPNFIKDNTPFLQAIENLGDKAPKYGITKDQLRKAITDRSLTLLMTELENAETMHGAILPFEKIAGKHTQDKIKRFIIDEATIVQGADEIQKAKNTSVIGDELFHIGILDLGLDIDQKHRNDFEQRTDIQFGLVHDFAKHYFYSKEDFKEHHEFALEKNEQWRHDDIYNDLNRDKYFGITKDEAYSGDRRSAAALKNYNIAINYLNQTLDPPMDWGKTLNIQDKERYKDLHVENKGNTFKILDRMIAMDRLQPHKYIHQPGEQYQLGARLEMRRRRLVLQALGEAKYSKMDLDQINATAALYELKTAINEFAALKNKGLQLDPIEVTLEKKDGRSPEREEKFIAQMQAIATHSDMILFGESAERLKGAILDGGRIMLKAAGFDPKTFKEASDGAPNRAKYLALKKLSKGLEGLHYYDGDTQKEKNVLNEGKKNLSKKDLDLIAQEKKRLLDNENQYVDNVKTLGITAPDHLTYVRKKRAILKQEVDDLLLFYDKFYDLSPEQQSKVSGLLKYNKNAELNVYKIIEKDRRERQAEEAKKKSQKHSHNHHDENLPTGSGNPKKAAIKTINAFYKPEVYMAYAENSGIPGKAFGYPGKKLTNDFLEQETAGRMAHICVEKGIQPNEITWDLIRSGKIGDYNTDIQMGMRGLIPDASGFALQDMPEQTLIACNLISMDKPGKGMEKYEHSDGTVKYYKRPSNSEVGPWQVYLNLQRMKLLQEKVTEAYGLHNKNSPAVASTEKKAEMKTAIASLEQTPALDNTNPGAKQTNTFETPKHTG